MPRASKSIRCSSWIFTMSTTELFVLQNGQTQLIDKTLDQQTRFVEYCGITASYARTEIGLACYGVAIVSTT